MNPGQFRNDSYNLGDIKTIYFKWTMTAATTFVINRSQELLAGTAGIVRTGTGVYDIFPRDPPGVELIDWNFDAIEAAPSNTSANSGKATVANNLSAANGSKVTVTFRNNSASAATDFANTDIVYGWIAIQCTLLT